MGHGICKSRSEAITFGAKRFFSGDACPHGHVAERFTSSSSCVVCVKERALAHAKQRKDLANQRSKRWRENNPDRASTIRRLSKAKNRQHYRAKASEWNKANKDKVAVYRKVYEAKKQGRLKPLPCAECGSTHRLHAHHDDHSRPFDVKWLCQPCHNRLHNSKREYAAR